MTKQTDVDKLKEEVFKCLPMSVVDLKIEWKAQALAGIISEAIAKEFVSKESILSKVPKEKNLKDNEERR